MADEQYSQIIKRFLADSQLTASLIELRNDLLEATRSADHLKLMVEFVDHIMWICDAYSNGDHCFREILLILREYALGRTTIDRVIETRDTAWDGLAEFSGGKNASECAAFAATAAYLAILSLCGDELKKRGILAETVDLTNVNITDVANQCLKSAKFYAGAMADDHTAYVWQVAENAFQTELRWQIDTIKHIAERA